MNVEKLNKIAKEVTEQIVQSRTPLMDLNKIITSKVMEALMKVRDEMVDQLSQQSDLADNWIKVCRVLEEAVPGFSAGERSVLECAEDAVRMLASTANSLRQQGKAWEAVYDFMSAKFPGWNTPAGNASECMIATISNLMKDNERLSQQQDPSESLVAIPKGIIDNLLVPGVRGELMTPDRAYGLRQLAAHMGVDLPFKEPTSQPSDRANSIYVLAYDADGKLVASSTTSSTDPASEASRMNSFLELERAARLRGVTFKPHTVGALVVGPAIQVVEEKEATPHTADITQDTTTPVGWDPATAHFSPAAADVLNERRRQIEEEGRKPDLDDAYPGGALAAAGGCYALFADSYPNAGQPPKPWPWVESWWKPKDFRRDMVRAAALILAEIEKFDRKAAKAEADLTPRVDWRDAPAWANVLLQGIVGNKSTRLWASDLKDGARMTLAENGVTGNLVGDVYRAWEVVARRTEYDWKQWYGGLEGPSEVRLNPEKYEFLRRDGQVFPATTANNWNHHVDGDDIVAYRRRRDATQG